MLPGIVATSSTRIMSKCSIWPPYSPDLNPIEHLWDALDRRVRKRVNVPNNVAQLQLALIQEWNNIPQRTIDNLVGSMVRRVGAATAARGGHTRD